MSRKPGHEWDEHEWVFSHSEMIPTTLPDGCTIDVPFDVLYCECGARYSRHAEQVTDEVYEATDEEMAAEIRADLAALGLTFAELAAKAETRFDTEAQRRTWFAIKDLGHLVDKSRDEDAP